MSILAFIAGVEVLLLFVILAKIRENRNLLKEIRACNLDLALAMTLATQARFHEARAAARAWADRVRALRRGETYRRPQPAPSYFGSRLH
jgi:hypothetical protein